MRDCFTILYLDTLVRLSIHSDPDPGKNRTSQICTLPITVKGLPKDYIITKSWHLDECEMDENCSCKDQLILGKNHHELLSEYTDSEEKSLHALDVHTCMSLGIGLQTFDFETLLYECNSYSVDKNDDQSNISKELNDLNVSMQSITLEDQLCSEDENDTLTPVREIVDSTSDDASLNLENIADTDEVLDDVLQEADFMKGIRPLDISVDDEKSENVNAEQIMSTLNIIDDNNCTQDATTSLSEENFQATSLYFKQFIVPPLLCRHPTEIIHDFKQNNLEILHQKWYKKLNSFMTKGKEDNATFALHGDIIRHCGEILGISIAERTGGADGYNLLLGCVKSSLPFAFLNGATSYASFCVDLLHVHYTSGFVHKTLKQSLFTTPHKDSTIHFALDTQREMDHQDAIKGFRPRSTIDTIIPRMSIVDHFTEVQQIRHGLNTSELDTTEETGDVSTTNDENVNYDLSMKDLKFIIPVTKLILRVGALSTEKDDIPRNAYNPAKPILPEAILDKKSYLAGRFLITKYACHQQMFGLSSQDLPDISMLEGSKPLLQRLKMAKGITMRRSTIKTKTLSENEKKEAKRVALDLKRQAAIADCISSDMNTCQALVKPDCSKASLQKSTGIKKVLMNLLSLCIPHTNFVHLDMILSDRNLYFHNVHDIPPKIRDSVKLATVEFAGVKFKTHATSGDEYLQHISKGVIRRLLKSTNFPKLQRIVMCEEKYTYTPDDFKASTRMKRQKASSTSISHLKLDSDILSKKQMSKSAVVQTEVGKRLISNYLARHIDSLDIKNDLILDIDSELILTNSCSHNQEECLCAYKSYATPVRGVFFKTDGFVRKELLKEIKQRKGEAEMAQVDWLPTMQDDLEDNEAIVAVVTSADIDSIAIHLFSISFYWARKENGKFKNKVYVLLQKQKPELYNITGIIELLEERFGLESACNISIILCLGGNVFFQNIKEYHMKSGYQQ